MRGLSIKLKLPLLIGGLVVAVTGVYAVAAYRAMARAAVTVALDASMDAMIEEITGRVLAVLRTKQSEASAPAAASTPATAPPVALAPPEPPKPAPASASPVTVQPVRRVTPLRMRSTSVLGLDVGAPEPRDPE